MDPNRAHPVFRDQPSYTIFNKSFEDNSDVLFLQLNEIDPHFLTEEELNNKKGFLQNELIDPRNRKEVEYPVFNFTDDKKNCKIFKGGGIKSSLSKKQHETCLRVLLGWQNREEVDEGDLIVWRQMEGKMKKEREHMREFINKFEELHREEMNAPAKRFDENYRKWFKAKAKILMEKYKENVTFNTFTGLPHLKVCRNINGEKFEISNVRLLERKGWIRLVNDEEQINWRNFHFRFEEHLECFNESMHLEDECVFKENPRIELRRSEEQENGFNCFLPFESILFLLCSGDYIDLPTECLLEISNVNCNKKTIKFDKPLPARNCGRNTRQQMVEQALMAFLSSTGRSNWLHIDNKTINMDVPKSVEIHAINNNGEEFKPLRFEDYLEKYYSKGKPIENQVKNNTALIEWQLRASNSHHGIKILTALNLPPAFDSKAKKFLSHETLKLEYKPQFGCEVMTKYELLQSWLKMRLMSFAKTTDYGYCYRLSTKDCDIQLKELLTLEAIENYLKRTYHICPLQLIANLAEFLKLLSNMPAGKYMLRYNLKYREQFLLCAPSMEITQNTIYLHSLFQVDPTNMAFMTQKENLPIVETLCSLVHLKFKILPALFLPKLPHQKYLKTAESKAQSEKRAQKRKQSAEELANKLLESKIKSKETTKRKNKRYRKRMKKKEEQKIMNEKEAERKKLLEF